MKSDKPIEHLGSNVAFTKALTLGQNVIAVELGSD
jgi:hypothetical protein